MRWLTNQHDCLARRRHNPIRRISRPRYLFSLLCCCLCGILASEPRVSSGKTPAYVLDTGGLRDQSELYLVGVLQGIVNRDAPRLFLSAIEASNCAGTNNVYLEYLQTQKGFAFERFKSLNEAIAFFAAQKRADGKTPLIRGLVKYDPSHWDFRKNKPVDRQYQYWIAGNFAAQEDLLPVTDDILANKTPMLCGHDFWYVDTVMNRWAPMFVEISHTAEGMAVTPLHRSKPRDFIAYA